LAFQLAASIPLVRPARAIAVKAMRMEGVKQGKNSLKPKYIFHPAVRKVFELWS
jgi:hypothetical protein